MKKILTFILLIFIYTSSVSAELLSLNNDSFSIDINYEKDKIVKEVDVEINLTNDNGILTYSFDGTNWEDVNNTTIKITKKITENGTYNIQVKDLLNNISSKEFEVTNIDSDEPIINELSVAPKNQYSQIIVVAEDILSGLASEPYSCDNGENWSSKNTCEVFYSDTYFICVKDRAGNIATKSIEIKINNEKLPQIGNILYGKNENGKQKVTINIDKNYSKKIEILVKKSDKIEENDKWNELENNQYVISLEQGNYHVFLRLNDKIIDTDNFNVNLSDYDSIINPKYVIFIISISLILISILILFRRRRNKV